MANEINLTSFEDAADLVASWFIAGIDSAIRHSIKGDAQSYRLKKDKERTASWKRGYEFGLNCANYYGLDHIDAYSKNKLGTSCHDAMNNLIHIMRDGDVNSVTTWEAVVAANKKYEARKNNERKEPTMAKKETVKTTTETTTTKKDARTIYRDALNKYGIEFSESPVAIWFDMKEEAEESLKELGARFAPKREKKGKTAWYFACPAA